jgi:hypothetical protein
MQFIKTISLRDTLKTARELTESPVANDEYVRGQADLISSIFGLFSLGGEYQDIITGAITHRLTVAQAMQQIMDV